MRLPPINSGSMAALVALTLSASACSTVDESGLEQGEAESYGGEGEGDGDGDGEGGQTDPEAGDTAGTETGEEDPEGELPPAGSVEDPPVLIAMCDLSEDQVVPLGLREAQLEAAPELVSERVLLGDGAVPQVSLSAQPFFNHFTKDYAPAEGWDPELSSELWLSPMVNNEAPPRYHLQYALRGPAMQPDQRLGVDLAVVIDLGPGMPSEALELTEEALAALDAALAPGDRVTLIGAGESPILLGTVLVEGYGLAPLTGLLAQEGFEQVLTTPDLGGALELAYGTLATDYEGQGQPRVLLLSNGHFDPEPLEDFVEDQAILGRYLVTIGVGDPALFDDGSVRELAREGRGTMLFAPDAEQLWVELQEDFIANFLAAATELELHLTLPAGLALRQRGSNSDDDLPDDPELAMLAPNDALVFHHELEACGEIAKDAVIVVELEWSDPITEAAKQAVWELPVAELAEVSLRGQKGAATVAYVRALRSFRDGLAATQDYSVVLDAISLVSGALEAMPDDPDLIEMSSVMARLF